MKILKASSFYLNVITGLYHSNLHLSNASYEQQYRASMDTLFGWADFWKINLEKLNDFEVIEVITNNKNLQTIWAEEHNYSFTIDNWAIDILEAQIHHYQPDILFAHDYNTFTNSFLAKLKKEVPSIKLVIGWDGLRYNNLDFYAEYDLVLSPAKDIAEFYQKNGKLGYFFPFGFETSILDKIIIPQNPMHNVSFVGSIMYRENYHIKRFHTLGYIVGKTKLDLWASAFPTKKEKDIWQPFRYTQRQRLKQKKWKEWLYIWRLGSINSGGVFGKKMYETIANSKMTINTHIDVAGKKAGNIRLYEATGVGTCLITDWKENLHEFFKLEEEVITYKTPAECVDKVKYLLKNENERKKVAQAGQKRVLKEYSFERRIKDFVNFLEKKI